MSDSKSKICPIFTLGAIIAVSNLNHIVIGKADNLGKSTECIKGKCALWSNLWGRCRIGAR